MPPHLRTLKSNPSTRRQLIKRCKSYHSHADIFGQGHRDSGHGSFSTKNICTIYTLIETLLCKALFLMEPKLGSE